MKGDSISLAWVNLTGGGMSGGPRKYVRAMLPLLHADPRIGSITVHSPAELSSAVEPDFLPTFQWPAREHLHGFPTLRRQLRECRPDVVFVTTSRWVNTGGIPIVVSVRNMEPLIRPLAEGRNGVREGLRNITRRIASHRACVRADGVIAVSHFVADYLRREWHIEQPKLRMIYHGLGHEIPQPTRPAVLSTGLPFVFTAGSIRPFRGLEDVIHSAARLGPELGGHRIVIAGSVEGTVHAYHRRLMALTRELGVADKIIWAGKLTSSEMIWCYRQCLAFLMTSRVEACPNTALEAMEQGAACISTSNPPMPEFFGDAARYYQAGDAGGLAEELTALHRNEDLRRGLGQAARCRARMFNWETTARETADFLVSVAMSARRGNGRRGS